MNADARDPRSTDAVALERHAKALSHELRSSARQVKSFTQLLGSVVPDSDDGGSGEYLRILGSAADSLQTRIEGIDWFFALTAGELHPDRISLVAVFEKAVEVLADEIAGKGAVVRIEIESGDYVVNVDAERIAKVATSLVTNCLTFCDAPAQIHLSFRSVHDVVEVTVSDTGPGFGSSSPEDAFELFRRFHGSDYPGLGVGLAGVQTVIERHGGHVQLTTSPSAGTAVTLTLPH